MTGPRTVDVYWVDLRRCDSVRLEVLSEIEIAKIQSLRRADDQRRSAVAAALLRSVLAPRLGRMPGQVPVRRSCPSCGGPHGKPVIDLPGAPFVSLSHAAHYVVLAVTEVAEVGVDVESADQYLELEDGALVLAPDERAWVEDRADLLRCWVRKEAVVKATGDGLRAELRGIRVTAPAAPPGLLSYDGRPQLLACLHDLRGADETSSPVAALAVLEGGPLEVHERQATGLFQTAPRITDRRRVVRSVALSPP